PRAERKCPVAHLLVLSSAPESDAPLPALELLSHRVDQIAASPAQLVGAPSTDLVIVDARGDLVSAKSLCRILHTTGIDSPLLLVSAECGRPAVSPDWGVDDVVLTGAGPAEIDARIRLVLGRKDEDPATTRVHTSGLTIDEASYSAKVRGTPLDLTFKEFQ